MFFSKIGNKKKQDIEVEVEVEVPQPDENIQKTAEVTVAIEKYSTAAASHIGTREYQQDALYASGSRGKYAYGVLCDGMGGMEAGEKASSDVVEYLANQLELWTEEKAVPELYQQAIVHANEMILGRYCQDGHSTGTTLVSAFMHGENLFWASVGDSRIYIIREEEIVQMTRDHNYALELAVLVAAGNMTPEEAAADPQKEALISYIGAPELSLIDINQQPFLLKAGDQVLLCSDGLTKSLSDEKILEQVLSCKGDIKEAARNLPLMAFDEGNGTKDNTSVILMRYQG